MTKTITMPPERLADIKTNSERSVPYVRQELMNMGGNGAQIELGETADAYMFDADRDRRELLMLIESLQERLTAAEQDRDKAFRAGTIEATQAILEVDAPVAATQGQLEVFIRDRLREYYKSQEYLFDDGRRKITSENELVPGMVLADREGGAWWAGIDPAVGRPYLICLHTTERPGWSDRRQGASHVLAILAPVSVVWAP